MRIQICNPNLCKSHLQLNWKLFFPYAGWPKSMKFAKFFHRVIFAFFKSATQIYVNPIHFEIQLILRKLTKIFFCIHGPDYQNRWNRKNCPKFFHRVIFAFWIQIWNPNLCKSHTFWNTANIENWPFFAYILTKIDVIGKIARNSFIG